MPGAGEAAGVLGGLRDASPRVVGPYRIVARLGAGGMGEVFLAADERRPPRRTFVAVKTVHGDLADDEGFRSRFRREIETGRAVSGRYTARLLDGDADGAPPWLATEYVPGPNLEEAVRGGGPLPEPAVRALGRGLVAALRSIHHARVLHRDLKPANVLLTKAGPKVIDFGIARAFGASTMTATGRIVGSPGFMSPEHVAGSEHVVAASDVFCLASLLCYAATGRGPFGDGPLAAVLFRIARAEADLTGLPHGLREVLAPCLAQDASSRPDTAELARLLADEDPADAGGGGATDVPWPAHVTRALALREAALEELDVRLGNIAAPGLHDLPTVTAPRRADTGGRRQRRGPAVAVVASLALLAGAGLGGTYATGRWPWPQSPDPAPPGPSASPSGAGGGTAPAAAQASYVDELGGPDRGRSFDAAPSLRPAGWRPWTVHLPAGPVACAADHSVMVCRLADGSIQALRLKDGARTWRVPPAKAPEPGAAATGPVLAGSVVVTAEEGRLRARATADGSIRWEKPLSGRPLGRLLGVDTTVYVNRADSDGIHSDAYALADGHRRWTRLVAGKVGGQAERQGVLAYAPDQLYVNGEEGLAAWSPATGKTLYEAPSGGTGSGAPDTRYCPDPRLSAGQLVCPDPDGRGLHFRAAEGLTTSSSSDRFRLAGDVAVRDGVFGPPAVGSPLVLELPAEGRVVRVHEAPYDGLSELTTVTTILSGDDGRPASLAPPVVIGQRTVFADNATLHVVPPEDEGPPFAAPVPGAPGNRAADGTPARPGTRRAPTLLSVGGIVLLGYFDGTVRAQTLPER
ncbi:protein kinase [Streptomyces sp. NPDC059491]|uniref:protein kinase domain-containing protein n=1 Tax=Streptomyces sp. NPDC059491 TaxID=3346850 RepID=UPI00368500EC